jgi:hypothetical protein
MNPIVFIVWRIRSLWAAIIRSTGKTVVRIMHRREVAAGRQTAPTGCRRPYAARRLPFLKYAPYTARDGIRRRLPNRRAGATGNCDFSIFN